jgi:uncharacterized protein YkwD
VSAAVFDAYNAFRATQGLGPVRRNANIDIAVKNHSPTSRLTKAAADAHNEVAGKPGFTGASPQ